MFVGDSRNLLLPPESCTAVNPFPLNTLWDLNLQKHLHLKS